MEFCKKCKAIMVPVKKGNIAYLKCRKCGRESALEDEYEIICPVCDSADVLIEDGKDITIKTIDYDAPN